MGNLVRQGSWIKDKDERGVWEKLKDNEYFRAVPPTNISMVGYSTGQRIDIRENEEFELTCKVSNAKPVAEISWYRDNVKYDAGEQFERNPQPYMRLLYKLFF